MCTGFTCEIASTPLSTQRMTDFADVLLPEGGGGEKGVGVGGGGGGWLHVYRGANSPFQQSRAAFCSRGWCWYFLPASCATNDLQTWRQETMACVLFNISTLKYFEGSFSEKSKRRQKTQKKFGKKTICRRDRWYGGGGRSYIQRWYF